MNLVLIYSVGGINHGIKKGEIMETTKYESVFKNPEGFTQQEITQLRTKAIAFSRALVGRRLNSI